MASLEPAGGLVLGLTTSPLDRYMAAAAAAVVEKDDEKEPLGSTERSLFPLKIGYYLIRRDKLKPLERAIKLLGKDLIIPNVLGITRDNECFRNIKSTQIYIYSFILPAPKNPDLCLAYRDKKNEIAHLSVSDNNKLQFHTNLEVHTRILELIQTIVVNNLLIDDEKL